MTDVQLYTWIGTCVRSFHWENFHHTGLLKDFNHDIYLHVKTRKDITEPGIMQYVKMVCRYHPLTLMKHRYYHRLKSYRPVVLIDASGNVDLEFRDDSQIPDFEFLEDNPRPKHKGRSDAKRIVITYKNGVQETFNSVGEASIVLGVSRTCLYPRIGKEFSTRYTKRKLSHIKLIEYADNKSLQRE